MDRLLACQARPEADLLQRGLKHACDVYRIARCAITNLMAAARAVRNDQRICRRIANARQQRELTHCDRHIVVPCFVPEASRHAAAARHDGLDSELRYEVQDLLDIAHLTER